MCVCVCERERERQRQREKLLHRQQQKKQIASSSSGSGAQAGLGKLALLHPAAISQPRQAVGRSVLGGWGTSFCHVRSHAERVREGMNSASKASKQQRANFVCTTTHTWTTSTGTTLWFQHGAPGYVNPLLCKSGVEFLPPLKPLPPPPPPPPHHDITLHIHVRASQEAILREKQGYAAIQHCLLCARSTHCPDTLFPWRDVLRVCPLAFCKEQQGKGKLFKSYTGNSFNGL